MGAESSTAHATAVSRLTRFLFTRSTLPMLLVMALLGTGVLGYNSMIKESLPDLAIPQALIVTEWAGAAPALVEKEVTERIEKAIRGMEGLRRHRSGSMDSLSIVAVEFHADTPVGDAMARLRAKVSDAIPDFPKAVERPHIEAISVRDVPIITFVVHGDLADPVLGAAAKRLARDLERVAGIKKISAHGLREPVVQVQLIPEQLRALGVPGTLVLAMLKEHSHDVPWGRFESAGHPFSLTMEGAYRDVEDLRALPIRRQASGRVIRLDDLAHVESTLTVEYTRPSFSSAGAGFRKCVALSVFKAPGRDSMALVAHARALVGRITESATWNPGIQVEAVLDESELISDQLRKAFTNAWQAMVAVFVVLFVLLTWREATVAALSIPLTLVGATAILWVFGYTFNILVIIGMILALGLLVDDFILILEGMHDGVSVRGMSFVQAALHTVRTYAVPSLSGSLTTILVFAPLAAIGGVDGKFIRLIPVTAAVCLVISYLASILIDIPLSRVLFERRERTPRQGWADRVTEAASRHMCAWLRRWIIPDRRRALVWLGTALALFCLSLLAALALPNTMYPKEDGRELGITVELPSNATLDEGAGVGDMLGEVLRSKPYVQQILRTVGEKDALLTGSLGELLIQTAAPNLVGFTCVLTPRKQRQKLGFEYAAELRGELAKALADVPGAALYITPEVGGATSDDPVQIDITGTETEVLRTIAGDVAARLREIPGTTDVRDTFGQTVTHSAVQTRREALDFHGISESDLAAQMRVFMDNDRVAWLRRPGTEDDIPIRLGTFWKSRKGKPGGPGSWEELSALSIITESGQSVPLSMLVDHRLEEKSPTVPHKGGRRCVTVKCRTEGSTAQAILDAIRPHLERIRSSWPPGYDFSFGGEHEAAEDAYASVVKVFLVAVFVVFAILALQFDSLIQPIIILFSVLFALTGVFAGFFLAGIAMSFTASIGIVSLVGIVVNDAIVMIATMNQHRKSGLPLREAAARGASDRLRPIVSTSVTTIVGLVPLALSDPGWAPLCLAIVFGLLAATVASPVLIPCLYVLATREEGEKNPKGRTHAETNEERS